MNGARLQLVQKTSVAVRLNQYERESIATRALVFGIPRGRLAREYGVVVAEINEICDAAMFRRGVMVERNRARFGGPVPPMGRAA